jgi:hypothetical protein
MDNKIKDAENKLATLKAIFSNNQDELKRYLNTTDDFLETEAIDKKRRYGIGEFKRQFLHDPAGKVSSFMRTFIYIQSMETLLIHNHKALYMEILRLEKHIQFLKNRESGNV